MASLTDLPTACRFAVLHVTDDEDETGGGSKAGTSAKGKDAADGTNATKAKKKRNFLSTSREKVFRFHYDGFRVNESLGEKSIV